MNKEIEEMANGYYIENNKIVYFSNMLDGYTAVIKNIVFTPKYAKLIVYV